MTLVGDRKRFAVEFEVDEDPGEDWLFGKFCYWIGGERVGDYELRTSLQVVIGPLASVVRDRNHRENSRLFALPGRELFSSLDAARYGSSIPSVLDEVALDEQWARHDLTLPVDIFDRWKVFLVEHPPRGRIVYGKTEDTRYRLREADLDAGEADRVLEQAFATLGEDAARPHGESTI